MNNTANNPQSNAVSHYSITDKEFSLFQTLIYDKAGISMSNAKKCLVVSRLTKRLRYFQLENFEQYYALVMDPTNSDEMQVLVDLLTTNETYFFREEKHFDFLRDEVLARREPGKRIRVWSAAASRGQEPYSLAMVLADKLGLDAGWELQATDINSKVLDHAREGLYSMDEAVKIPNKLLNNWCLKGVRSQQGSLLIDKRLRQRVDFKYLNLIGQWPDLGLFSVIFLRNVMIYFDLETKKKLVDRLRQRLEPGGYLVIGHSETLNKVTNKLKIIQPSIYQRVD